MTSPDKAWVTLATNDSYSLGALVLAHSLKSVKTVHKLAILITPGVTPSMKQKIEAVFDEVRVVDVLDSKDEAHLALMNRPELGVTFTKLHCWTFTNYEKCVFLDADTLVLQNCDELFEREELSAAPDPGWPDCFNTGVFVYKPSQDTFGKLLEFAKTKGSFDGGDQGLLNMYFKEWSYKDISKHLSFTYNVVWSSTYSYLPALKQFGKSMKIIHFITSSKPWLQSFNTETRLVTATSGGAGLQELLQLWWDLFCRHVHPELSTEMIESRLSSRYSYDYHPAVHFNNNEFINCNSIYTPDNNNFKDNHNTSSYEPQKEEHYNFVDPWEEYLVSNNQKHYEIQGNKVFVCRVENVRGDGNVVEVSLKNQCEQKIENNNYNNQCEQEIKNNYHTHSCDMKEQTKEYSFQNNVIEKCNAFKNEEKHDHCREVSEFNQPRQNQETIINNEIHPACSEDIPINLNSNSSVNNCRPDSPTHCEIPMDQTCDLNGGLAGQFARVSLGEKPTDQMAIEDFLRRQSWEHGNVDYLGKDSFVNIWAKINETLGSTPEVKIDSSVVKTSTAPEVVYVEEPKPLKSALKKTSTTIPPVESELNDIREPLVKQLEKLNLTQDNLNQSETPNTPTVTSPTPPTTPASQAQESTKPDTVEESPKPEAVEPVKETPKPDTIEPVKETPTPEAVKETPKPKTVEPLNEIPKPEVVESVKETKKTELVEPVKETPKPETIEPVKETPTPEAVKETPKPETIEPVKETPTPEAVKETPKPKTVEPAIETKEPELVKPLKEIPKPEVVESVKETLKSDVFESVKEWPKPEVTKEAPKSVEKVSITTAESVKQTPKSDESTNESLSSIKPEQISPKTVSSGSKLDEPAKATSQAAQKSETPQKPVDSSGPLESSSPPVAPKRTNKGSASAPKPAQPSEKK